MFKKQHLALAIAATLAAGAAHAELETSVVLKNETARFLKDGIRTGEATSFTDTAGTGKSTFKFENTAQIFLNDDLGNGSSWHGELKVVRDSKAIDSMDGHENYSQQDYLRELYVDTTAGDWDLRLGKQQVVWGTADGIKLLDNINPTDWREMNQNAPADARIPVWMINAERYLDNGDNVQLVLSQAKKSKIAGMDTANGATRDVPFTWGVSTDVSQIKGTDAGAPFIMKGVDTITGAVNGFFNIGATMGQVASQFSGDGTAYDDTDADGDTDAGYSFINPTGNDFSPEYNTVGTFTASTAMPVECGASNANGAACLKFMAEAANNYATNLTDADITSGANWDTTGNNPNSMFEYMPATTFATFNAFVDMNTKYVRKSPDDLDANLATRFRTSMDNGANLAFSYAYAYDPNPVVQVHWENSSGQKLSVVEVDSPVGGKVLQITDGTDFYGADANFTAALNTAGATDVAAGNNGGVATLVFEETLERVHNLGMAGDYALELSNGTPVVLRGEFLYQKDVRTPVIDREKLGYGDITGALKMEKNDYFKYVLGADVTVLTDMMLSGQFIQFRNMDYVDNNRTCTYTADGINTSSYNCSKYTADQASMHLTNGLKKAEENKEFYSIFLSKPFGDSGEGRWNNIFIYEEGGGKWNRFDVEYGFDDQLIGTFEVNKYFGNENTMFGQFENASNVQIGVKYLLQ